MRQSPTLSLYLARHYSVNILILLLGLMGLIYFFDSLELLRRASKHDDVPLTLVLQMGLFKLPEVTQTLLPTAILLSAIYTFWSLTQKLELIMVRAAGFSALHFLTPIITVALLLGALQMTTINPIGALMVKQYEKMENIYLKRNEGNITLFEDGLWMRQTSEEGETIIHSKRIEHPHWKLKNVIAYSFDKNNALIRRIDAPEGSLIEGHWEFSNAVIHAMNGNKVVQEKLLLPTKLSASDIEESFASPETISFWQLPAHIKTLSSSGFDASKLKVHYHSLLAQPVLFSAMILIAAGVAMRLPRTGSGFTFIITGIFTGITLFFISNFMQALGASGQIPIILSAWSPAILSLFLGISLILHMEEE